MSCNSSPAFERYIGIDYSGAQTPTSSLKGLRVFVANRASAPIEVQPPYSPRKYWTRRGVAEWIVDQISAGEPTLVGIDHGFSFPLGYFEVHRLPLDWAAFLDDFQRHWPTDEDHTYVDFVRDGSCGDAAARSGDSRWRRLTEIRVRAAKSVFHFDVQGSVAKSTHAGLPWLRYLRDTLGDRVHFWPFDGWDIPARTVGHRGGLPGIVESRLSPGGPDGRPARRVVGGRMAPRRRPGRKPCGIPQTVPDTAERELAQIEGWILGSR